MKRISDMRLESLRSQLERHPRQHGYYIIDLVSIKDLRESGRTNEEIMDVLTDLWYDEPSDRVSVAQSDQTWADYRVEFAEARTHTIEALVGGRDVGHTRDTISKNVASECFDQFIAIVDDKLSFYIRLGIGNADYVFNHGVVAIGEKRAGILWVVEGD